MTPQLIELVPSPLSYTELSCLGFKRAGHRPARLCLGSVLIPCTPLPTETRMGKGDKRTKRGKIFRGSYGKTRSHKKGGKSKAAKKATA